MLLFDLAAFPLTLICFIVLGLEFCDCDPDKMEFIFFGAKDRYKWLSDSFPINILGNCLSPTDVVRNLGVLFNAKFSFTNHVISVIKSCFISLRDLHHIRRFLSVDTSVVIANALVSSCLDYCNSLFRSLSSRNATRLQYVQNAFARFVTGASKYTHITSTLMYHLQNPSFGS